MNKDLAKLAAAKLRELESENAKLKESVRTFEREKSASQIVEGMISNGLLDNTLKNEKISELMNLSEDDFQLAKRASKMWGGQVKVAFGKLDDQETMQETATNPIEDALIEHIQRKNGVS